MMIVPERAPVRPRILSPSSGEALLLEEEVLRLIGEGKCCVLALRGSPGSGKTTALRHLAAVLPADAPVQLADDVSTDAPPAVSGGRLLVCTVLNPRSEWLAGAETAELAPWGIDEWIEYLLAVHADRCASVMRRLGGEESDLFQGLPDLWRIVLDHLADDAELPDARAALHRHLSALVCDTDLLARTGSACLNTLLAPPADLLEYLAQLARPGFEQDLLRVLRHPTAQVLLAVERMSADLNEAGACDFLACRMPRILFNSLARAIRHQGRAHERLRCLLAGPPWGHAMAASLLHAVDRAWTPGVPVPHLAGAYLDGASWPGVNLAGACLREADLTGADLRRADCTRADLAQARLGNAQLAEACLEEADLTGANLAGAILTDARATRCRFDQARLRSACFEDAILNAASFYRADLRGALFLAADLTGASLIDAIIADSDFTGANLHGALLTGLPVRLARWTDASFQQASLQSCDLEGLDLPGADFHDANLHQALLTGAHMPGADFRRANLRETGLAHVDWEGADLRGADLIGATFHLGSSRSGLVGSLIACEGSRTGFYTDDYEEQYFQPPEQIRKANLQGADLRGALVESVDFYLVDLRGAQYDADQEQHFRHCRAIL
jgi:uncharacterized protein YjbI with pentapeptide repeats